MSLIELQVASECDLAFTSVKVDGWIERRVCPHETTGKHCGVKYMPGL